MANGFAPVDIGRARQQGLQNALNAMKGRQTVNTLARNQAVRQTGQQAAQGGYSFEEHANALRQMGYTDAANQLLQQQQKRRQGQIQTETEGLKYIAARASQVGDQQSYEAMKRDFEELGLADPGELPDEFSPEVVRRLAGEAQKKVGNVTRTISGKQANEMFGTQLDPGAAVTIEMGQGGSLSISDVQAPTQPDRPKGESINLRLPNGEVVSGIEDAQGNRLIRNDQGQLILAPRGAVEVGIRGTPKETGLGQTEERKLRDLRVNAENFIATTGDAIEMLRENPDINTFVAGAAGVANSLQQEGKAIARAFGKDFDESVLEPSNYAGDFDDLGIQNNRMRSIITSLAFQAAAASGQTGRSVSDADVRRFIKEVGAGTSDPRAFARTLRDVAARTARRFRINYEVRRGEPFEGDLGVSDLPRFEPQGGQAGPTRERAQQQTGVEIDDETQRLLEKYQ
jgi:hypothetical protein